MPVSVWAVVNNTFVGNFFDANIVMLAEKEFRMPHVDMIHNVLNNVQRSYLGQKKLTKKLAYNVLAVPSLWVCEAQPNTLR